MTQKAYFGGRYVGCDRATGLGLPDLHSLAASYGLPVLKLAENFSEDAAFLHHFHSEGPAVFRVPIDPEQTYFPKNTSRVREDGGMESHPLDQMTPPLSEEILLRIGAYLLKSGENES